MSNKKKAFTESESDAISKLLRSKLGPEWISFRCAGGGKKVAYVEGWKAIALANETFGFDGWNSSVKSLTTDHVQELNGGRYSVGITSIIRVELKDGTYHEDLGYGVCEGQKSLSMSLEKAKKEAVTDGLKRALRSFGNGIGNCVYDKAYLSQIKKIPVEPLPELGDIRLRRLDTSYKSMMAESRIDQNKSAKGIQNNGNGKGYCPSSSPRGMLSTNQNLPNKAPANPNPNPNISTATTSNNKGFSTGVEALGKEEMEEMDDFLLISEEEMLAVSSVEALGAVVKTSSNTSMKSVSVAISDGNGDAKRYKIEENQTNTHQSTGKESKYPNAGTSTRTTTRMMAVNKADEDGVVNVVDESHLDEHNLSGSQTESFFTDY